MSNFLFDGEGVELSHLQSLHAALQRSAQTDELRKLNQALQQQAVTLSSNAKRAVLDTSVRAKNCIIGKGVLLTGCDASYDADNFRVEITATLVDKGIYRFAAGKIVDGAFVGDFYNVKNLAGNKGDQVSCIIDFDRFLESGQWGVGIFHAPNTSNSRLPRNCPICGNGLSGIFPKCSKCVSDLSWLLRCDCKSYYKIDPLAGCRECKKCQRSIDFSDDNTIPCIPGNEKNQAERDQASAVNPVKHKTFEIVVEEMSREERRDLELISLDGLEQVLESFGHDITERDEDCLSISFSTKATWKTYSQKAIVILQQDDKDYVLRMKFVSSQITDWGASDKFANEIFETASGKLPLELLTYQKE